MSGKWLVRDDNLIVWRHVLFNIGESGAPVVTVAVLIAVVKSRFAEGIGRFYHTADGEPAKLRHIVLQTVIRVEGTRAWGRSQWLEMANYGPGDEPKIGTYGIYEDEFRKVGGRWLIARRRVLNEFIPNRNSGPGNPVREMDAAAQAARVGD